MSTNILGKIREERGSLKLKDSTSTRTNVQVADVKC